MMKDRSIAEVGAAVRSRREALGLSQSRLARLAGLSRATINEFEAGATDLGIAKVLTIMRILGVRFEVVQTPIDRGWLESASRSASASYRTVMPAAVLARAIRTGSVEERYRSHLATFLDEASPAVIVKAVAEAYRGNVPPSAWRNIAKMARATMSSRSQLA